MNYEGTCRRCGQRLDEYFHVQQQLRESQEGLEQQVKDTRYWYDQHQQITQQFHQHEQALLQKDQQLQQLQEKQRQHHDQQQGQQQEVTRLEDQIRQLQRGEEGLRRVLQEKEKALAELSQVREESARHREDAESLRQQLAAKEQSDRDTRKDTSRYTKAIQEQDELLEKHRGEVAQLRSDVKALENALNKSERENRDLAAKLEELTVEYGAADSEASDLVAANNHLRQRIDELKVQCAAQQQFEAEFDAKVTNMLDERDKSLTAALQDRDKLDLKVHELQEEVSLLRRDGGIAPAEAQEMLMQFREKELLIQELEEHCEELEQRLAQVQQDLTAAKAAAAPKVPAAAPPPSKDSVPSVELVSQYEKRLADFKADAVKKDQRIIDIEKKLRLLAAERGAEALLDANLELERQAAECRKNVTEAKRDLSQYLAEAAMIVYENDLLRSISNVPKEQLNPNLEKVKLREKVTAAKAIAAQKNLEREVQELEDERVKLKTRMRELSELAAGKVSLLHDLQPEQMLQLEEIAASMKKGKLQLPVTDETRQLKKDKADLEKKLAAKDRTVSEHVDKRVDELIKKTNTSKELEIRVLALEKENASLKDSNKEHQDAFEKAVASQAQQREALLAEAGRTQDQHVADLLRQILDSQTQVHVEMQQAAQLAAQQAAALAACSAAPGLTPLAVAPAQRVPHSKAAGPSIPPTPAANASVMLGSLGGITPQNMASLQRSGIFLGPQPMQRCPGMPVACYSTLLQTGVQLPRSLSDIPEEAMSSLYCQVVECLEELARERELRRQLSAQVKEFRDDYDRLVAEKEVLFADYLRQREEWASQQRLLETQIRRTAEELKDSCFQLSLQQEQCRKYRALESVGDASVWKKELDDAMARIAILEHNESIMARKLESATQDHALVKQAFDNLEKDFCDRERFLKERLAKAMQWKKQCVKALREARKRHREMVQAADFEEVQRQLQASRQRETDLARRQTELVLAGSEKEDRLREMGDLQSRVASLDNLVRETEQEFVVLRRRLQVHEPRFAVECALFIRLAAELQQRLGYVGRWEAAERALAALDSSSMHDSLVMPEKNGAGADRGFPSIEVSLDEKLRQIDSNNDGWITLQDFRKFLSTLGIQVSDGEVRSLADGFHASLPPADLSDSSTLPAPFPVATAAPDAPAPAAPSVQDVMVATAFGSANVSVLAIVGRFRLFGLRALEPRELFWAAMQFSILNRKLDTPHLLKSCQVFRTQDGYIEALHIVRVFQQHDMAIEELSSRSLRRVLSWLGADPRDLENLMPLDGYAPPTGDPREVELRGRLLKLRLVYHSFADSFEKGTARAALILRPPDADVDPDVASAAAASVGPTALVSTAGADAASVHRFAAEAREAAASRRCVILEQEVRARARTVQELQRQVGELEDLVQQVEGEKYDERGKRMELQAKLGCMVPRVEVEPQLRKLEELKFEVDRSRLALRQSKDMARVCAAQAESYEQLVKRRQQEVRHLQETVRILQSGTDVANTVGKLQYRLLLSQWEKTNSQRQLQSARDEVMQARRELLENEDETEKEKSAWEEEKESMQHRIIVLRDASEKQKEQAMSCLPIDKARELRAKVEEIASKKMQLEAKLLDARRELHRNQADTAEYKLRWQQAQELVANLTEDTANEAPRQRHLDMAKKLESAKLSELRHKRDLDIEHLQAEKLRAELKMANSEVERLQNEVAQAELKLATEEELWRERILEVQKYALDRAVIPEEKLTASPETGKRGPMTRKPGKESLASMEELYQKLVDKEAKLTEMQVTLDKAVAEKEFLLNEEKTKVRQLQLELNLMNEGEVGRLRQTLHAEHTAEINEISAAAKDTVNTLQSLLNDAEARNKDWETNVRDLQEEKRQLTQSHLDETNTLQQELARLHQELIHVRHTDGGTLPSPLGTTSVDLDESLMSVAHEGDYIARLEELRHRGLSQEAQIEQMQVDFREVLEHQRLEHGRQRQEIVNQMNKQREEFLQKLAEQRGQFEQQRDAFQSQYEAHYRGHAENRDRQFRSIEEQMHNDFRSAEEQLHTELGNARDLYTRSQAEVQKFQAEVQTFQAEVQKYQGRNQELLQQHHEYVKQHDFALGTAHEETRRAREEARLAREEIARLHNEIAQERDQLAQEREKYKESNMRRQQINLKRALDKRNEELKTMKREVESLKKEVEKLEDTQYREGKDYSMVNENDMKRLVKKYEERYRALQDHVAQLTLQIQRRKEQDEQAAISKADQEADRKGRQQQLEQLLDEASVQLHERAAAADRVEEEAVRLRKRADEADKALELERYVLQGEVQVAKQEAEQAKADSRRAAEAAARRVAAMREQLDVAAEERGQLTVQVRGLEAASAVLHSAVGKGPSPTEAAAEQATAEIHEELRQEKLLREKLQQEVSNLHQQLELAHVSREKQSFADSVSRAAGRLPSASSTKPGQPTLARPHSMDVLGGDATEIGSPKTSHVRIRSASPRKEAHQQRGLLDEAEARREEMKAEAVKWQAKAERLETDVDDLKLRLAAAEGTCEADKLRNKMESVRKQNQQLLSRNEDLSHQIDMLRHQLAGASEASQSLVGEAQRHAAVNRDLQQKLLSTGLAIERERSRSASPPAIAMMEKDYQGKLDHMTQLREHAMRENSELRKENDELRRNLTAERASHPPSKSPVDAVFIAELQAKLQAAMHERQDLQRQLAAHSRSPPLAGGTETAAIMDLRAKLEIAVQEKSELQRVVEDRARGSPLGGFADAVALADMRSQVQHLIQERENLQQDNQRLKDTVRVMGAGDAGLRDTAAKPSTSSAPLVAHSDSSAEAAQRRIHMQEIRIQQQERSLCTLHREVDELLQLRTSEHGPNISVQLNETRRRFNDAQHQMAELRREKDQMRDDLSLLRAAQMDAPPEADGEFVRAQREIAELKDQLSVARQDKDQLRDDIQLLQAARVDRSTSPSQAAQELRTVRAELHALQSRVAEQQLLIDAAEDLKPLRSEAQGMRLQLEQVHKEKQKLSTAADNLKQEVQSLQAEVDKYRSRSKEQQGHIEDLEQQCQLLRDDLQLVRAAQSSCGSRDGDADRDDDRQPPSGLPGRDLVRAHRKISEVEAHAKALQTHIKDVETERDKLKDDVNLLRQMASKSGPKPSGPASPNGQGALPSFQPQSRRTTAPASSSLPAQREQGREMREIQQEVRSTRDVRDKLYQVQMELEATRRRLEVDARTALEREREVASRLGRELEDSARTIEALRFDLRRARTAAAQGAWAQQDEEQLRMELHVKKLEEELATRRSSEVELSDKLLERDHELLELRFEHEQSRSRYDRMEQRIKELELLSGDARSPPPTAADASGPNTEAGTAPPVGRGAAAVKLARKERGLEHVVEGLERVVTQQKADIERLKRELEGKSDSRRHRAEADKLRKRIRDLESEASLASSVAAQKKALATRGRPGSPATMVATAAAAAGEVAAAGRETRQARRTRAAAEEELEEKDRRIKLLEASLFKVGPSSSPLPDRPHGGVAEEAEELKAQLSQLRTARSDDAKRLEEAHHALREAELNERRHAEVVRENKRLRADLTALEDDGFWDEIQTLQTRCNEGALLARDCAEELRRLHTLFPSARQAGELLARLDRHANVIADLAE